MAEIRCQIGRPHPALRPWVSHYWLVEGEPGPRSTAQTPSAQTLFPGANVLLVVQLDSAVDAARADGSRVRRPAAFAEGHHRHPFRLALPGRFRLAGAEFLPGCAHPVLGGSQEPLNDAFVDLAELAGREARVLAEEAAEARSLDGVKSAFDRFLLPRAQAAPSDPPGIRRAVRLALATNGNATVAELAAAAEVGPRQLERRFRRLLGLSPKYFSRVLRFNALVRVLESSGLARQTEGAHSCGYYDQPHMIRDFRRFTGEAPSLFLSGRHELHRVLARLWGAPPG